MDRADNGGTLEEPHPPGKFRRDRFGIEEEKIVGTVEAKVDANKVGTSGAKVLERLGACDFASSRRLIASLSTSTPSQWLLVTPRQSQYPRPAF